MTTDNQNPEPQTSPRWRPLEAIERRVLGVLIEKAKTTPENYPLSLNSLRTGCNQKNNRSPLMQLEEDQVEEALENLRKLGAVSQIQGGARVDKYRHLAYEWLGVEKVELAVMAELLLRGTQTVGELRGRAARMEPIKDLGELQPTLDALAAKGLIVSLTPPGRGSVVTHALYMEREMEKVRREIGSEPMPAVSRAQTISEDDRSPPASPREPGALREPAASPAGAKSDTVSLASDLHRLQVELAAVKREFLAARADFEATAQDLRRQFEELNRQLGN